MSYIRLAIWLLAIEKAIKVIIYIPVALSSPAASTVLSKLFQTPATCHRTASCIPHLTCPRLANEIPNSLYSVMELPTC